ncbi:hypothetical protein BH09BAC5_BH09BAC5_09110 [soil metagenome]
MHYFDRSSFTDAPLKKLNEFAIAEKPKWIAYRNFIDFRILPKVSKPSGHWTRPEIKLPLIKFFNNNCGYCGEYAGARNSGEVDHYLPAMHDANADHIYSWENYIWSCHPCNNLKRSNYFLLNPCSQDEMEWIEFDIRSGNYRCKKGVPSDITDKFKKTNQFTFINGNNRPKARLCLYKILTNVYLPKLLTEYKLKKTFTGSLNSTDYFNLKKNMTNSIKDIWETINCNRDNKLIGKILISFSEKNPELYSLLKMILEK